MNPRPLLVLAALCAATSPNGEKNPLESAKDAVRDRFARDPMGTVLATVLGGAWLFYRAEHGHNPKVQSFYDALVYVATNLSVGYSDIFAKTPRGKAIGSVLMTYGPAMATKIFEPPSKNGAEDPSRAAVERLDRILAVLEAQSRVEQPARGSRSRSTT